LARSPVDSPRLAVLLAAILMVCGGVLRGWAASWGYISDEVCWLFAGGVVGEWAAGETAVNPPALRMIMTAIGGDHWHTPAVGRAWSFAVSTGAIGLMFWLGRLVGQNRNLPGFIAAFYLTFLPLAIQEAGWYRSYATLVFVVLWHLIALVQVVDSGERPRSRTWVVHLVVSAALLPQVHYVGVAILLFEGLTFAVWLRDVRFIAYFVPAALLFAPLGYRIVTGTHEHLAPDPDRLRNYGHLFVIHVYHPVLTGLVVLSWFRLHRRQRALLLAAIATAVGLLAVANYHAARLELGIVPAAYMLPLLASLPMVIPARSRVEVWARRAGWVVLSFFLIDVLQDRFFYFLTDPRAQDGPPMLVRDVQTGRFPHDRPIYLEPPHTLQPVYYYLERQRLLTECPVDRRAICFRHGEHLFLGFENRDLPSSYVVVFSLESREEVLGAQCSLVGFKETYWVWDCPRGWKAP
jgi:hypothetical protein